MRYNPFASPSTPPAPAAAPAPAPRRSTRKTTRATPPASRAPKSAGELLDRATPGDYSLLIAALTAKGIPAPDIDPHKNVFTFRGWLKLGRCVAKGQSGIKIPVSRPGQAQGLTEDTSATLEPDGVIMVTVFHISQTRLLKETAPTSEPPTIPARAPIPVQFTPVPAPAPIPITAAPPPPVLRAPSSSSTEGRGPSPSLPSWQRRLYRLS